ncbi:MAG: N-acetylmuramoyl-L-alanine amidase [Hespellia sp.]|nr:N-acetylmuramoyl-L-alanine amidase [Hespellia sp.]
MKIIETNLTFGALSRRSATSRIIIHNAAAVTCSAEDIHRWHLANGWAGAGYHFLVRKDGSIYRLRPEWAIGAHTSGSNSNSIGICFEGDYNNETSMPAAQMASGKELVAYIKGKYGFRLVQAHQDVCATDCPGHHFPFSEIAGASGSVNVTTSSSDGGSSSIGASGNWIAQLQSECNAQGFSNQAVDGIAGPNTLAGCPMVRKGARGNITKIIQSRVGAVADGIFGAATEAAVKAFQRAHGLVADGIVGPKTWCKLLGM